MRIIISNAFGMLEYWSDGVMAKGLTSFFNTPILQYSMTPVLHDRDFRDRLQCLNHLNIVYRPVLL